MKTIYILWLLMLGLLVLSGLNYRQLAVGWGRLDLAQAYAEEALTLSQVVARPVDVLDAHMYGGDVAFACADYPRARTLWTAALQLAQYSRAGAKECAALARLGRLYMEEGNIPESGKYLQNALRVASRFRKSAPRGYVYEQLARLAAANGQTQKARAIGKKCLEIYDQMRLREADKFRRWLQSV